MIYVTISTRNRFWHSALTAMSVANANWQGCFIHVLDDATDDDFAEAKEYLFNDLLLRNIIHRYEKLPEQIGFCRGRELMVNRFAAESRFLYWLHLDDDILIGPQTVQQALRDVQAAPMDNRAILHLYANPWAAWKPWAGPFARVTKIGGACYLIPKGVMLEIGNPYTDQTDGEKANAGFWQRAANAEIPMVIRWTQPYQCQHTGNVESTIFGHTPKWEAMYAKDFKTGNIIEVPPFRINELRSAIKGRNLSGYVWRANTACREKVKLPAPGSQTGVRKRSG